MRNIRLLAAALLLAACSSELPHESPFDALSALEKQAKARLSGVVRLENETDHSQVTLQLQNDKRTYTVQSLPDGSVALTGIVPGAYRLNLTTRYFEAVSRDITFALADEANLGTLALSAKRAPVVGKAQMQLQSGAMLGGIDVTLTRVASVRGGGAAAPGFSSQAEEVTAPAEVYTTTSDTQGNYQITGVAAGIYDVTAVQPGTGSVTIQKVRITGEDGTVRVSDLVLFPMFGGVEVLGKNASGAVSTPTVTLRLFTTGSPSYVELSSDPQFLTNKRRFAMRFTTDVTLPPGDGLKTFYARYFDELGNVSSTGGDTVVLDTTPPAGSAFSIQGPNPTNANSVTLSYFASGAAEFRVVEDAISCGGAREPYGNGFKTLNLSGTVGLKTVRMQFFDAVGNASPCLAQQVYLDSIFPAVVAGSVALQRLDGTPVAQGDILRDPRIWLLSDVSDDSPLEMQVSTSAVAPGLWEPYSQVKAVDLPLSGMASISARVRDSAGNVIELLISPIDVSIDNSPPLGTLSLTSATPTNNAVVSLSLGSEAGSSAQVSTDPLFTGAVWFPTAATTLTLSAGDGIRTIYAHFRDLAGNVSDVKAVQVTLDQTPPQGADFTISAGTLTNSRTVGLSFAAVDATDVRSQEGASCGGTYGSYGTNGSVNLTPGDGIKSISVQYRDAVLNETACITKTVTLDETPPTVNFVLIAGNAPYATNRAVSIDVSVTGATQMQVAENSTFSGASWQPVTSSVGWILSAGEGGKTVFARFRDDANNIVSGFSDDIVVDTIAPTFNSLMLPAASAVTLVTLSLSAAGADEMRISENADFSGAVWTTYNPSPEFYLANNQGTHTIYAQVRDAAANVSIVRSVNVVLDSQAPATPLVSVVGGAYTQSNVITLQIIADSASEMLISQFAPMTDVVWAPFAQLKAVLLLGGDGGKTVYVKVRDAAGNESGQASANVIQDGVAPNVALFQAQDSGGNAISVTNQLRYYVRLDASDASPLTVQFSPSPSFTGVATEGYSAIRVWDVAPPTNSAGENRATYVRLLDAAGNVSTPFPVNVLVDNIGPTAPNLTFAAALVSDSTVAVNLYAVGAADVELSDDIAFLNPVRFAYTATTTHTLPAGDGVKSLYARYVDAAGNASAIVVANTTLDTTAPQNPAVSIVQASPVNQFPLTLQLSSVGADFMSVTEDACGSVWESYATSKSFTPTSPGDGPKTVAVRYRDALGHVSSCVTAAITLDTVPPTVNTFVVNDGSAYATNRVVTVTIDASGADEMQLSESPTLSGAAWVPFTTSTAIVLSTTDGPKTVYAKFRDRAGNTATAIDGISLDTAAPSFAAVTGTTLGKSRTVMLTLAASGADSMILSDQPDFSGASWLPYAASTTFFVTAAGGTKLIYVQLRDDAGNWSVLRTHTYELDTAPPAILSAALDETPITGSMTLTVRSNVLEAAQMEISESPVFAGASWVAYAPARTITLVAGSDGPRSVYVNYRDAAGNETGVTTLTTELDKTPPLLASFSINSGDSYTRISVVSLSLDASDGNGVTEMMIADNAGFVGGQWEPVTSATGWLLSATDGLKNLYLKVRDQAGNVSDPLGASITLDSQVPYNAVVVLDAGATYTSNRVVTVGLTAVGADEMIVGLSSDFQGSNWQPYGGSTTLNTQADGARTVYARFRDAAGNLSDLVQDAIIVDTVFPLVDNVRIDQNPVTSATALTLTLGVTGADEMQLSESATFVAATWAPFAANPSFNLTAGSDGARYVYVRFRDLASNTTAGMATTVELDRLAPSGVTVAINGTDASTAQQLVTLTLGAVGATQMMVSESPVYTGAAWEPYAEQKAFLLSATQGPKTVYAKFRDALGNASAGTSDTIDYDSQAPQTPSIAIVTSVDGYASAITVSLVLAAANATYMMVSESSAFTDTTWAPYSASLFFVLANVQGDHRVYAIFKDDAGNQTSVVSDSVILDTIKPSVSRTVIDEGFWATNRTVHLTLFALGADTMKIGETSNMSAITAQPYASVTAFDLSLGDSTKSVYVQFQDVAGNATPTYALIITLDTQKPAIPTVTINAGASYANSRVLSLDLGGDGTAFEMMVDEDPLFGGSAWQLYKNALSYTLQSADDGVKWVYVRYRDRAGNVSDPKASSIELDSTAPQGPFVGKAGAPLDYANSLNVAMMFGAAGANFYRYSIDGAFDTETWTSMSTAPFTTTATVGSGDGLKSVWAQFKDNAGNLSAIAQTSFFLDTLAPQGPAVAFMQGAYSKSITVDVQLTAAGADMYELSWDGTFDTEPRQQMQPMTSRQLQGADGLTTVWVRYVDRAENYSSTVSAGIVLDRQKPTVGAQPLLINGGDVYATSPVVTLTFDVANATEMHVSNQSNFNTGSWEPVTTSTVWFLSQGDETKNVYVRFRDAAANIAGPYSDSIVLDTQAPSNPGASLAEGNYSNKAFVQLRWEPSLEGSVQDYKLRIDDGFGYGNAVSTFAATTREALLNGWNFSSTFALRATYTDGSRSALSREAVEADAVFAAHPKYLLVVDQDDGTDYTERVLLPQLTALGYTADVFAAPPVWLGSSGLTSGYLDDYQVVIWNNPVNTIPFDDLMLLDAYTQTGGNLFLISPSLPQAWSNMSVDFVTSTLGVLGAWNSQPAGGGGVAHLDGRLGDVIADGLAFDPQPLFWSQSNGLMLADPNDAILTSNGVPYGARYPRSGDSASRIVFQSLPIESLKYANAVSSFVAVPFVWRTVGIDTGMYYDQDRTEYTYFNFNFPYFGELFSSTNYTANGSLSFDYEYYIQPYTFGMPIPSTMSPNRLIAPWRRDLMFSGGSQLLYNQQPDIFTMTWNNLVNYANGTNNQFQTSLFPDGTIEFSYGNVSADAPTTVGVEDTYGYRGASLPVSNYVNQTFRYSPPIDPDLATYLKRVLHWVSAPEAVTKTPVPYVTVLPSANGATEMQISIDGTFDTEPWVPYSTMVSNVTLPAGGGTQTISIRYRDSAGNTTVIVSTTSTLDYEAPSNASVVIDSGATYTRAADGRVALTLSVSDSGSGVSKMILSTSGVFNEANRQDYRTTLPYSLASTNEGTQYVWARFIDAADNYSEPVSSAIIMDRTAPAPLAVTVASGAAKANDRVVTVNLYASDNYVVNEMQLANDASFSGATWQAFSNTATWTLATGEGTKTVYVRYRDGAGNISSAQSDAIVLDQTAPENPQVTIDEGHLTNSTTGVIAWQPVEQPDVAGYRIITCDGWCDNPGVTTTDVDVNANIFFWEPPAGINDWMKNYLVVTKYADGSTSQSSPNAYFPWQQLSRSKPMLVVDDDGETSENDLLLNDLAELGYDFDVAPVALGADGPSWGELSNYHVIIWASGDDYPLTMNDENALSYNHWRDRTFILFTPGYAKYSTGSWNQSQLLMSNTRGFVTPSNPVTGYADIPFSSDARFRPIWQGVTVGTFTNLDTWRARPMLSDAGSNTIAVGTRWYGDWQRTYAFGFTYAALAQRAAGFQSAPYYWEPATIDTGIHSDDFGKSFPLPFTFPYYGGYYDIVNISSNGFLSFQSQSLNVYNPPPIPDAAQPNAVLALLWRDLNTSSQGNIRYSSYPNAFTVTYDGVPNYGTAITNSFQVTLKPNGEVIYAYNTVTVKNPTEIGIENLTGTQGVRYDIGMLGLPPNSSAYSFFSQVSDPTRKDYLRKLLQYATPPQNVRRTNLPQLNLTLSAGGATEMQISTDGTFDDEPWTAYQSTIQFTLPDGQGQKLVYVKFRDDAGNESVVVSDYTVIDTVAPYPGTSMINNGASYTNSRFLTMSTPATEASRMMFSEQWDFAGAVSQAWSPMATYVLSDSTQGWRTVYVRYFDDAGNHADSSAGIYYDETSPDAPIWATPSQTINAASISVQLVNNDPQTNEPYFDTYQIKGGQYYSWTNVSGGWPPTWSINLNEGDNRIYVRARDMAGNLSSVDTITIVRDSTQPNAPGTPVANAGNGSVTFTWPASSSGDVVGYKVYYGPTASNLNGSYAGEGASPIQIPNQLSFKLTGLPNNTPFYVAVAAIDRVGLESATSTAVLVLPNPVTPVHKASVFMSGIVDSSLDGEVLAVVQATQVTIEDRGDVMAPTSIGTIAGSNFGAGVLEWPHMYLLDKGDLQLEVWDVEGGTPSNVINYVLPTSPVALSVTSAAVVTVEASSLRYYSRSGGGALTLRATKATGATNNSIACTSLLCVVGRSNFIDVYDTGKSWTAPPLTLFGSLSMGTTVREVLISGRYAYVAVNNTGIKVVDLNNPGAPAIVGQLTFASPYSMTIEGSYLYVGDYQDGKVYVVDISSKTSPRVVGQYNTGYTYYYPRGVHVRGNHMLFTTESYVNLAELSKPVLVSPQANFSGAASTEYGYLSLDGAYLLGSYQSRSNYVEISNPSAPALRSSITSAMHAELRNGLSVRTYGSTLYFDRVSESTLTNFASAPPYGGTLYRHKWRGPYAFIADKTYGLRISDVTNPSAAAKIAVCQPSSGACVTTSNATQDYRFLSTHRETVFLTEYGSSADITSIDVSNPASPVVKTRFTEASTVYSMCNQGYRVVVGTASGAKIYDYMPSPPTFTLAGTVGSTYVFGCYLSGNYLYLGQYISGLAIYDIANVAVPVLQAVFDTADTVYDVLPTANLLYIGDYGNGLITSKIEP